MKFFFASVFVVVIGAIASIQGAVDWEAYKLTHGKSYDKAADTLRQQIVNMKAAEIALHNSNPSNTFQRELNFFSDMTDTEKGAYLGAKVPSSSRLIDDESNVLPLDDRQALPAALDYRTNKCLAAVKNQKQCGSCWAFSAIASLEFAHCKKKNAVVLLSEQQLVDCDTFDGGCNGGWYTNAWQYLQTVSKGSAKQALYPYKAIGAACTFKNTTTMIGARVLSYGYVQSNATAMQVALRTYGPLNVAIAVVNSFYSYKSGVYTDTACDGVTVNHAVNVVGWGVLNKVNYWIVRNSWGATWGAKGYILMQRGVNKCSIETYPAYVVAV